ncbi:hypothetical protein ETB97_009019 [Aspergillus alliaceus]|uniref:DUF7082 domain-containing protein n=1 Tax=Petromyces alliaceus TaxID=209559 RepID=A0A8H6E8Z1_PETAA|nr:hypothetical protein ETB97_009019 [Aspergillus burnettii]
MPRLESEDSGDRSLTPRLVQKVMLQPGVAYFFPDHGSQGTLVSVCIQATSVLPDVATEGRLGFGDVWAECIFSYLGFTGSMHKYMLSAYAPSQHMPQGTVIRVPLWFKPSQSAASAQTAVYVGLFTYQTEVSGVEDISEEVQPQQSKEYRTIFQAEQLSPDIAAIEPIGFCIPDEDCALRETAKPPEYRVYEDQGSCLATQIFAYNRDTGRKPSHNPLAKVAGGLTQVDESEPIDFHQGLGPCAVAPLASMRHLISLKLQGFSVINLTTGWTKEETSCRRRIVKFRNQHRGPNHINICAEPVFNAGQSYHVGCISCIYWPSTNQFFITSTDIIRLLEVLLQKSIPTIEKNRIRQNLQRLHPWVVSKYDPETCQFAQWIFEFRNPEVLKIRKSVRLFRWCDLPAALVSILHQYGLEARFLDSGSRIHANQNKCQNALNAIAVPSQCPSLLCWQSSPGRTQP